LALLLVALVAYREWDEVAPLRWRYGWHRPPVWLVLLIVLLTLGAAVWEIIGNKLSTSRQEIRFVFGVRSLLLGLEKLARTQEQGDKNKARFNEFLESFLDITASTFSGHSRVDTGFMVKHPSKESVLLLRSSRQAPYPESLEIPLPSGTDGSKTGPAGVCFARTQIVYVPKKKRKEAWPFSRGDDKDEYPDRFQVEPPCHCWVAVAHLENFRSVLCVPVAVYSNENERTRFGVLNFSTKKRDPFVDRDLLMAECFAGILGQAFAAVRRRSKKGS